MQYYSEKSTDFNVRKKSSCFPLFFSFLPLSQMKCNIFYNKIWSPCFKKKKCYVCKGCIRYIILFVGDKSNCISISNTSKNVGLAVYCVTACKNQLSFHFILTFIYIQQFPRCLPGWYNNLWLVLELYLNAQNVIYSSGSKPFSLGAPTPTPASEKKTNNLILVICFRLKCIEYFEDRF